MASLNRKFLIGGNWKMNTDSKTVDTLVNMLNEGASKVNTETTGIKEI